MMKNIKFIIVCICLLLVSKKLDAQIDPPNFHYKKLKGDVKSLKMLEYEAVEYFGELKKDSASRTTYLNFDYKNNVLNWREISKGRKYKNNDSGEVIYTYDLNFFEAKEINRSGIVKIDQWKYDNNGNIIEKNEYQGDSITKKEIATFNKNNKITEYKIYYYNGKLVNRKTWTYNLSNQLIEFSDHSSKEIYKYKSGLLFEKNSFDAKGNSISKTSYFYYKNRILERTVEVFINSEYDSKNINISRYNSKGIIISKIEFDRYNDTVYHAIFNMKSLLVEESNNHSKDIYTYDNNDKLIKEENLYFEDKKPSGRTTIVYSYDSKGNVIKKLITYYENMLEEKDKKYIVEMIISYR